LTRGTRARLDHGARVRAVEYLDSQRLRSELRLEFRGAFEQVDLLLAPSAAAVAQRVGDTVPVIASWPYWAPFNLTGVPTITVPNGTSNLNLPLGVQLAAPWWAEDRMLEMAAVLESARAYSTVYTGSSPGLRESPGLRIPKSPGGEGSA